MKKLSKDDIGLGAVRNRISPSNSELSALQQNIDRLTSSNILSGTLTALKGEGVTSTGSTNYTIDISDLGLVNIVMDSDNYSITLAGGEEGKPVMFSFSNTDKDLRWTNLNVPGGVNQGLSYSSGPSSYVKTLMEVVRLGTQYYLLNIFRERPTYMLNTLVKQLNLILDPSEFRILGASGVDSQNKPVNYSLGANGALILGTTQIGVPQQLDSRYDFFLTIPLELVQKYNSGILRYYIDQLEEDVTKYYIKLM